MLKKYKNELPSFFEQIGFKSGDFRIRESGQNTILTYRESPMKFTVIQNPADFNQFVFSKILFNPQYSQFSFNNRYLLFDELKKHLEAWTKGELSNFIYEQEGPDQFDAWLNQHKEYVNIENIDFESNEPFNKAELETLKAGLLEVKDLITEKFDLAERQKKILGERIEYLIAASERASTKTDWKNILISTVITIGYDLAFNAEKSAQLWALFGKVLNKLPKIGDIISQLNP